MEITLRFSRGVERQHVVGAAERNLKMIREALGVNIVSRDGVVRISGESQPVGVAQAVLEQIQQRVHEAGPLDRQEVLDLIADEALRSRLGGTHGRASGGTASLKAAWDEHLAVSAHGRPIRAQTGNQQVYLDAIRDNDMVFSIGPAGTGKTYLAVAAAVHMLRADRVTRLILVRPAVEAGEKLGFLPGDMQDKVNPYLRPLFDALHDMMDFSTIRRFIDNDVVEVAPLAFMRGRTLNNAAIILDEAQNTTIGQMKMFLTRMGHGSKVIVTGDTTQIDLPDPTASGLVDAAQRLRRVPGVAFVTLDKTDVVRHNLVQRIIEAYGEASDS